MVRATNDWQSFILQLHLENFIIWLQLSSSPWFFFCRIRISRRLQVEKFLFSFFRCNWSTEIAHFDMFSSMNSSYLFSSIDCCVVEIFRIHIWTLSISLTKFILCSSLSYWIVPQQTSNGQRKLQNTTSLSIPSVDDDMIDITPRNQNYSSTMGTANYERQSNSPPHHSTSYARDRELNDAEGKNLNTIYSLRSFLFALIFKSIKNDQTIFDQFLDLWTVSQWAPI